MDSFSHHQIQRRAALRALLGRLPHPHSPRARLLATTEHPGYTLQLLELDLNGQEPVPAYLLLPHRRPARAPALLYLHAHGGTYALGKDELIHGRRGLDAYAPVLAERGIITLACDSWCFGARCHTPHGRQGEHDTFKLMLWRGQVLWGQMLHDELQALSFLAAHPDVDATRIGAFGMSMGATKAWWLAALDERIRLCIDLCCLTDFDELIAARNLRGHSFYYFVPGLLPEFSAAQINELIVPRPRLSLNGRHDALTPVAGVERIRAHLQPLYARHGNADDCRIELFDSGHEETPAMRRLVLDWLQRYLVQP
ncbi:MAG: acetylxylan esterase [Gemmataceae bacterium]